MKKKRIDWFRVFADMRDAGLTLKDVANRTGISRTTMFSWKEGREPKHSDGEIIISLWLEVTGLTRASLPEGMLYKTLRVYRESGRS